MERRSVQCVCSCTHIHFHGVAFSQGKIGSIQEWKFASRVKNGGEGERPGVLEMLEVESVWVPGELGTRAYCKCVCGALRE